MLSPRWDCWEISPIDFYRESISSRMLWNVCKVFYPGNHDLQCSLRMWAYIPHEKDINFVWAIWYGKEPRSLPFSCLRLVHYLDPASVGIREHPPCYLITPNRGSVSIVNKIGLNITRIANIPSRYHRSQLLWPTPSARFSSIVIIIIREDTSFY